MTDLMQDVNYLRFFHTTNSSVRDKDILKNDAHQQYSHTVSALMTPVMAFQFWQMGLSGHAQQLSLYRRVRVFKVGTLIAAVSLGSYEMHRLQKKWTYYNRFYPEPTELQKSLEREAMSFKEEGFKQKSVEDRLANI
jgi:hypothetical protein